MPVGDCERERSEVSRVIVALSGGKASAWCADWALRTYPLRDVILYFNDTKWEHPDLYRFLNDLSAYLDVPITNDSDGRSPEDLFYSKRALASQRMPFCSKILKAKRLQAFYQDGDTIVFGIGPDEEQRADRIFAVYGERGRITGRWANLVFPLIDNRVSRLQINAFLERAGITEPELYRLGFTHNNCSGGCVRAGRSQWRKLYELLPDVYAERERVEREVQAFLGKPVTILKGISLTRLREQIEDGRTIPMFGEDDYVGECIGVCGRYA